jgi:hypothetical protein
MVRRAKAQRVDQRDRPRAHCEDIAQNAANAGRCTLIGLDIGRVVVALHLEDGGLSVTDVDHARILARSLNNPVVFRREFGQVSTGRFVGAVLRPHHRVDAQFNQIGLTVQARDEAFPLVCPDAVFEAGSFILLGCKMVEDLSLIGHGRALAANATSRQRLLPSNWRLT